MAMASTWAELLARKWIPRAKDWGTCPNVGELMLLTEERYIRSIFSVSKSKRAIDTY